MKRQFFVDHGSAMSHNLDNWRARGNKRVRTGWAVFFLCLTLVAPSTCLADSQNRFPGKGDKSAWEKANVLTRESIGLARQNKIDAAIEKSRMAIAAYPFDSTYFYNFGTIFLMKNDFANAAKNYEKAAQLDPKDDESLYNLGLAYRGLKNNKMAEASYKRALSIRPDKFKALYNLGNVLRDEGRFDEARLSYDKAAKLTDANANAMKEAYRQLDERVADKKDGVHK